MKLKYLWAGFFLATALTAPAATNEITALLQQGLFDEEANQDLNAAIADYQSLAKQFDKDRQVAATAIYRLGECYRKLGQTNDAAMAYRRILQDFPEQTNLTVLSRQNLAGMGAAPAADTSNGTAANTAIVQADMEVATLKAQLTSFENLSDEKARIVAEQNFPNPVLTDLMQKLVQTEQTYASLTNDYALNNPAVTRVTSQLTVINQQIDDQIRGILDGLRLKLQTATDNARLLHAQTGTAPAAAKETATVDDDENKQIQKVQELIQNSPDLINAPERYLLYSAALAGQLRVATFLLDHGADVNLVSNNDVPLNAAVSQGNKAMVELLLSRGADVNARTVTGGTPLHTAIDNGYQAVAEVLLAHQANVNAHYNQANNKDTPLHLAVRKKYLNLILLLLKNGADVNATNESGQTPLFDAVYTKQTQIVKGLLAAGAKINQLDSSGRTPLSCAAGNERPDLVSLLLAAGADPNGGTFNRPLFAAIHENDTNSMQLLLNAGANPNQPSHPAWGIGHFAVWGKVDSGQYQPLEYAINQGKLEAVQCLLANKADANGTNVFGLPLVWDALPHGDMLQAMLTAGANPNVYPKAVPDAANRNNDSLLLILMLYPPTPNVLLDNARLLLASGANPNAQNIDGVTALQGAAAHGNLPLAKLLLDSKADPNIPNQRGATPVELAKESNLTDMISLLHQYGAVDDLPHWNALTISRPSANISQAIFWKGATNWNDFTLLELIGTKYHLLTADSGDAHRGVYNDMATRSAEDLPFPDLSHVLVRHPGSDIKHWQEQLINVKSMLESGDLSQNIRLQWGDVVVIPETDHPLNDTWLGFTAPEVSGLAKALSRQVQFIIQGAGTNTLMIDPRLESKQVFGMMGKVSFWLWPALFDNNSLLTSSDLAHVKVTRHDPITGKTQEWTFDCSDPNNKPAFWLRDGDIVEVPQK